MKKFIPYILIAAMIGTFAWLSFASSVSNAKQAEAQTDSALKEAFKIIGAKIFQTSGVGMLSDAAGITNSSNWGDWGKLADATIGQTIAWISNFTLYVSAKIFTLSSYLLDYAVDFSVKDFKTHIDQIRVINTGYKIVLNVANMLFIFILLYIAIKTILGVGGDTKKLLTNIIVVGLFINFSLFMTKAIIDASNIVAMGFYNGVQTEAGQAKVDGVNKEIISVGSVSTAMMAGMKLQTHIPSSESQYNKKDPSKGLTNFNIAMNQFGASALFLVSAFVFLSVALLFIVRFVALLFYMLFSPVAFLGMISPEMKEYSSKWWNGLQSQALFAPAFLFLAYLISAIINTDQLWKAVGGNDSTSTFYDAFSSPSAGAFPIIMNYVILMALMIGALITAKAMAGKGSAGVLEYTKKFQGWAQGVAGRNTLGRAAYLAGNNRYMAKLMAKSPTLGNFAKTQFDNVAGQKFGSKIGYADALKKSVDKKKKMGEFVGKAKVGKTDELIRKEEDRLDRMKPVKELKNNVDKAQREVERLRNLEVDMRAFGTWTNADIAAADLARETLQREEALMENRIDAESRVKDLASYKKKAQERMKKEYAKNLGYAGWGLGPLDKIFRSGADAAAEIRKPKGPLDKSLMDIIKEYNEQQARAGGGAGGTTGGAGGAGGTGTGGTTGGGTGSTTP